MCVFVVCSHHDYCLFVLWTKPGQWFHKLLSLSLTMLGTERGALYFLYLKKIIIVFFSLPHCLGQGRGGRVQIYVTHSDRQLPQFSVITPPPPPHPHQKWKIFGEIDHRSVCSDQSRNGKYLVKLITAVYVQIV